MGKAKGKRMVIGGALRASLIGGACDVRRWWIWLHGDPGKAKWRVCVWPVICNLAYSGKLEELKGEDPGG